MGDEELTVRQRAGLLVLHQRDAVHARSAVGVVALAHAKERQPQLAVHLPGGWWIAGVDADGEGHVAGAHGRQPRTGCSRGADPAIRRNRGCLVAHTVRPGPRDARADRTTTRKARTP